MIIFPPISFQKKGLWGSFQPSVAATCNSMFPPAQPGCPMAPMYCNPSMLLKSPPQFNEDMNYPKKLRFTMKYQEKSSPTPANTDIFLNKTSTSGDTLGTPTKGHQGPEELLDNIATWGTPTLVLVQEIEATHFDQLTCQLIGNLITPPQCFFLLFDPVLSGPTPISTCEPAMNFCHAFVVTY